MIVLGIDPGTATTGWAVLQNQNSRQDYIGAGVITTSPLFTLEKRLAVIFSDINTLIQKYQPQVLVLEQLFFNTNAKTALLVGQARGVVLLAGELASLKIASFTPLQVKIAITGYGRADKKQMQEMVKTHLRLNEVPRSDDAADALAIALTYCFTKRFVKS